MGVVGGSKAKKNDTIKLLEKNTNKLTNLKVFIKKNTKIKDRHKQVFPRPCYICGKYEDKSPVVPMSISCPCS